MKKFVNESLDEFLFEKKRVPKTKEGKRKKMEKVMHHWKQGQLHIGKSDKKVPKTKAGQKQSIAIGLSMSGQSKK